MSVPLRLYSELVFADGLTRARMSGCKCYSIREGKRAYHRNITIRALNSPTSYPAHVESCQSYTLAFVPFEILQTTGYKSLGKLLMHLRKFYPEMKYNSVVTVVEFTGEVPPRELSV
jgi:hypothetical protein